MVSSNFYIHSKPLFWSPELIVVFVEIRVSLRPTPPTALTTQLEEEKEEKKSLLL
jgi:hypothetical protein